MIIQDHLGSNRKVLADGSVVQGDDFYAFGEGKNNVGSGNDYKYTGKELDETGLYYYGARYYSSELGRFIQADALTGSVSDPLSLNRYAYVKNNPLKYVDPTGNLEKRANEFVVKQEVLQAFFNTISDSERGGFLRVFMFQRIGFLQDKKERNLIGG